MHPSATTRLDRQPGRIDAFLAHSYPSPMHPRTPLVAVALVALLPACNRKREAQPLAQDDGKGKTHDCRIVAGGRIDKDTVVEAGCNVRVAEPVVIDKGATLRIEAGARIAFAKGARVDVLDGALVVVGEATKPVTFTSAEASPAAGDWGGIAIASKKPGTSFTHAVVEHGGVDASIVPPPSGPAVPPNALADRRPAILVRAEAAPVAFADVTIRHAPRVGIAADVQPAFSRFERVHLEDVGGTALDVLAGALGAVTSLSTADPIRVRGRLDKSASWPKATLVVVDLHVFGKAGEPAVLTLAPESVVRVAPEGELHFGSGEAPGSLIAKKVLFTSAAPTPAAGDWRGLHFERRAPGTRLEESTVEYAGWEPKGMPMPSSTTKAVPKPVALAVDEEMKDFVVKNNVFRHNAGAAIGRRGNMSVGGCVGLDVAGHGNTSIGQPLCQPKSPFYEELEKQLAALGAIGSQGPAVNSVLLKGGSDPSLDWAAKADKPNLMGPSGGGAVKPGAAGGATIGDPKAKP